MVADARYLLLLPGTGGGVSVRAPVCKHENLVYLGPAPYHTTPHPPWLARIRELSFLGQVPIDFARLDSFPAKIAELPSLGGGAWAFVGVV